MASRSDTRIEHVGKKLGYDCKILAVAGQGSDQDSVSLGDGDKELANFVRLSIDAISLNDCHIMLVELEELPSNGSHIDNVEHICHPWDNAELGVLPLVNQGRIWDGFCPVVVVCRQVVVDQIRRLNMVHISESQRIFSVNAAIVCQCCVIADDDRTTESIWTLILDDGKQRDLKVAYQCTGRLHVRGTSMYRTV